MARMMNNQTTSQEIISIPIMTPQTVREICERVISEQSKVDRLLSSQEVAELLGLTVQTVWAMRRDGRLPYVETGEGRYMFRRSDIEEWIERRTKRERTPAQIAREDPGTGAVMMRVKTSNSGHTRIIHYLWDSGLAGDIIKSCGLSGLIVYLYLLRYTLGWEQQRWTDHKYCSIRKMAQRLKISPVTVKRALQKLEEYGCVTLFDNGPGRRPEYSVYFPDDFESDANYTATETVAPRQNPSISHEQNCSTTATETVAPSEQNCRTTATETVAPHKEKKETFKESVKQTPPNGGDTNTQEEIYWRKIQDIVYKVVDFDEYKIIANLENRDTEIVDNTLYIKQTGRLSMDSLGDSLKQNIKTAMIYLGIEDPEICFVNSLEELRRKQRGREAARSSRKTKQAPEVYGAAIG